MRKKNLCADSDIELTCLSSSTPGETDVTFSFTFTNLGDDTIADLKLKFADTLCLSLSGPLKGKACELPFSIAPGQSESYKLPFKVSGTLVKPQKIKGKLMYAMHTADGDDEESISRSFELCVNPSDMLMPVPINKDVLVDD